MESCQDTLQQQYAMWLSHWSNHWRMPSPRPVLNTEPMQIMTGVLQAKVASQIILLVLLLQYLLAPKVAKSMRQKAIMLCRAFTTTESQGMHTRVSPSETGYPSLQTVHETCGFLKISQMLSYESRQQE